MTLADAPSNRTRSLLLTRLPAEVRQMIITKAMEPGGNWAHICPFSSSAEASYNAVTNALRNVCSVLRSDLHKVLQLRNARCLQAFKEHSRRTRDERRSSLLATPYMTSVKENRISYRIISHEKLDGLLNANAAHKCDRQLLEDLYICASAISSCPSITLVDSHYAVTYRYDFFEYDSVKRSENFCRDPTNIGFIDLAAR